MNTKTTMQKILKEYSTKTGKKESLIKTTQGKINLMRGIHDQETRKEPIISNTVVMTNVNNLKEFRNIWETSIWASL